MGLPIWSVKRTAGILHGNAHMILENAELQIYAPTATAGIHNKNMNYFMNASIFWEAISKHNSILKTSKLIMILG